MFTIIIPTYNHGKFIRKAIDSVISQTFPNWEMVIVNDGSTDDTQELIENYSRIDKRIHPIHKSNGGTASAINTGLENAQGDWICWLSSDDWYEPDKLEVHKKYIDQNHDCEFFFSHFHMYDEFDGKTVDRDLFGPLPAREYQIPILFYRNYIMGVGICVSRNLWKKVGEMDIELKYAQDYDMWLKLLTISPGCFIPERTFTYRHHSGQGSETFQLACLFDASKSGIRYVNEHPFEDFFPLLDLNDSKVAREAVNVYLEVSSDPSSYIYSLGFHPALVFRLLEWVLANENKNKDELLHIIKSHAWNVNRKFAGSQFGDIWKRAEKIIDNYSKDGFSYESVSHLETGVAHYIQSQTVGHPIAPSLRKYLENYESINVDTLIKSRNSNKNLSFSAFYAYFIKKIGGIMRRIFRAIRGKEDYEG